MQQSPKLPEQKISLHLEALQFPQQREKIAEQLIKWLMTVNELNLPANKTFLNLSWKCDIEIVEAVQSDGEPWKCPTCSNDNPPNSSNCLLCSAPNSNRRTNQHLSSLLAKDIIENIPPGFPPEPRKPKDKFEGNPIDNPTEYKEYMKQKMLFQMWKESLTAYRMREKEGALDSCNKIIERLKSELNKDLPSVSSPTSPSPPTSPSSPTTPTSPNPPTPPPVVITTSEAPVEVNRNSKGEEYLSTKVDITKEGVDDTDFRQFMNDLGLLQGITLDGISFESKILLNELAVSNQFSTDLNLDNIENCDPLNNILDENDLKRIAEDTLDPLGQRRKDQEFINLLNKEVNLLVSQKDNLNNSQDVVRTVNNIKDSLLNLPEIIKNDPIETEFVENTQALISSILKYIKLKNSDQDYSEEQLYLNENMRKYKKSLEKFSSVVERLPPLNDEISIAAATYLEELEKEKYAMDLLTEARKNIQDLLSSDGSEFSELSRLCGLAKEKLTKLSELPYLESAEPNFVDAANALIAEDLRFIKAQNAGEQYSQAQLDILLNDYITAVEKCIAIITTKSEKRIKAESLLRDLVEMPTKLTEESFEEKVYKLLTEDDIECMNAAEENFFHVSDRLMQMEALFQEMSGDGDEESKYGIHPSIMEMLANDDEQMLGEGKESENNESSWPPRPVGSTYKPKDVDRLKRKSYEQKQGHVSKIKKMKDNKQDLAKSSGPRRLPTRKLITKFEEKTGGVFTDDLPENFPKAPPNVDPDQIPKSREGYKQFMKARLLYEQWENGVILYRMKMKEGDTEACENIIKRLNDTINELSQPTNVTMTRSKKSSINLALPHTEKYEELRLLFARMIRPKSGITIKDRTWKHKVYRNSFVGSEFVDWLIKEGVAASRSEAVAIGKELLSLKLIENTSGGKINEFKDGFMFYSIVEHIESPRGSSLDYHKKKEKEKKTKSIESPRRGESEESISDKGSRRNLSRRETVATGKRKEVADSKKKNQRSSLDKPDIVNKVDIITTSAPESPELEKRRERRKSTGARPTNLEEPKEQQQEEAKSSKEGVRKKVTSKWKRMSKALKKD